MLDKSKPSPPFARRKLRFLFKPPKVSGKFNPGGDTPPAGEEEDKCPGSIEEGVLVPETVDDRPFGAPIPPICLALTNEMWLTPLGDCPICGEGGEARSLSTGDVEAVVLVLWGVLGDFKSLLSLCSSFSDLV